MTGCEIRAPQLEADQNSSNQNMTVYKELALISVMGLQHLVRREGLILEYSSR